MEKSYTKYRTKMKKKRREIKQYTGYGTEM